MTQSEILELIDKRLPKRWMTTREAAKYIGRSASHLLQFLKEDIGYVPGRPIMFDRNKLDEWMEKNTRC